MTAWRALVRDLAEALRDAMFDSDYYEGTDEWSRVCSDCRQPLPDGQLLHTFEHGPECAIAEVLARADAALTTVRPETRENAKRHNRPMSEKARAYDREFRAASERVRVRSRGLCEARIGVICTGFGEHVHHRRRRSQGGGNAPENLVAVCLPCHEHIHANPAWAAARGWLVMSKAGRG